MERTEEETTEEHGQSTSIDMEMMDFPMDSGAPVTPNPSNKQETSASGGLFFADATLDLDEAHDIAETPEPQKIVVNPSTMRNLPRIPMPSLLEAEGSQNNSPTTSASATPQLGPNTNSQMNRIDSGAARPIQTNYSPKPPRRPRDIAWMVAFLAFVPLALLIAAFLSKDAEEGSPVALLKPAKRATFYGIVLAYGATLVLARLMYRTTGGGDGDDARHVASQVILAFAPISLGLHPVMIICMYLKTPNALGWAILPLWFLARDLFAMRQWRTTASTAGGRQAFFQALSNMALDMLSRSLRRSSFYRAVVGLLTLQLFIVYSWRNALLGALGHGSTFWFLVALLAGKWATGVVARLIGLIASGGVTSWFVQQSLFMEDMEKQKSMKESTGVQSDDQGYEPNMPEEYRDADASAYQPVLVMDEGIDDDFDDDEDPNKAWSDTSNSTVMSLLKTGLLVSFGSIVECGLLGGLAQFLWSVLRNTDAFMTTVYQRFPSSSRGFRGMQIGRESSFDGVGLIQKMIVKLHTGVRTFVRSHTDLAMCHVAAYYKSYQRAAQDVYILVDGSGVEPIIHDDITTHMCACVCGSVSGALVLVMGLLLDHHRHADKISDVTLVQTMLLAFVLSYTLLFTVMEPLRASIKAIYVCFAQHPHSLSQAYPLIYHRLGRISEANLV